MAGEEAENPKKAIPLANGLSMAIVMVMYILMSMALTLTVPYTGINDSAPFAFAFRARGLEWASIAVTLASLVAITGTTLGNLFAVPRCTYSMASDGLLFRCLAYVHPYTRTPVIAIITLATISGTCALVLDLETLAEMVSLGTLMAAFFVSGCVIVLRYRPKSQTPFGEGLDDDEDDMTGQARESCRSLTFLQRFEPGELVQWCVTVMGLCMMLAAGIFLRQGAEGVKGQWWWIWLVGTLAVVIGVAAFFVIIMHVQNDSFDTYKMPLAPLLPALSMFSIACLLARLSPMAWVRFLVWMAIGLLIYFGYGIRNSSENRANLLNGQTKMADYKTMPNDDDEAEKTSKES